VSFSREKIVQEAVEGGKNCGCQGGFLDEIGANTRTSVKKWGKSFLRVWKNQQESVDQLGSWAPIQKKQNREGASGKRRKKGLRKIHLANLSLTTRSALGTKTTGHRRDGKKKIR